MLNSRHVRPQSLWILLRLSIRLASALEKALDGFVSATRQALDNEPTWRDPIRRLDD